MHEQQENDTTVRYSEDRCYEILRKTRWPNGTTCPRCGCRKISLHSKFKTTSRRRYLCALCRKTFTDFTGTVFARTNLPLRTWFAGLDLVRSGLTTSDLAKELKIKWDTAAYLQRRIGMSFAGASLLDRLRQALRGEAVGAK